MSKQKGLKTRKDSYDVHVETIGENQYSVCTISWNPFVTGNFANPTLAEIIAAAKKEFRGIPFENLIVSCKGNEDGFIELSKDPLKDIN